MRNAFLLLTSTFVFTFVSWCLCATTMPPDSTTSLVDKSSAIYIIEEGKTLFNEGKVRDALIKFREASVKDPNSWKAAYWVGKCHYQMHNYGYALRYANQALELGDDKVTEEIHYLLGSTYHRLSNIDSALIHYELSKEKLTAARATTLMIDHHIKECHFAKEQLAKEGTRKKVRLGDEINSGYDDYNVVPTDGGKVIYFVSRRSNTTGGGMNPDDQQYFEDTYRAIFNETTGTWDSISNELGKINSDGFDALNYMSPDGTYGVMTLNNTAVVANKKSTRGSDLCELKLNNNGKWNSPKAIKNKTINTSFFEGAASLTADGNTMFFISDRKADKSGTDIYMVTKEGKSWGTAKVLPANVNSPGNETTPYITPDGRYLFFSSNGHVGMGGYDIYVTENLGGEWSDPVNLGVGINSVNNDTHFVYLPEQQKAFLTGVEIIGSKASFDIYEIDLSGFVLPLK